MATIHSHVIVGGGQVVVGLKVQLVVVVGVLESGMHYVRYQENR